MATNWTLANATKEVLKGNKEAIQDIGRRFPLTLAAILKMNGNEGAVEIISSLPDYLTTRKIEAILKDGVSDVEETDDVEEEVMNEPEEEKEEKPAKKGRGRKKAEVKEEEEAAEEEDEYSSMNAMELFKLCKKRGIKVEPKKKAAEYIKLLKADDAKSKEADQEDDDWDEEEDEKPAKKPAKKSKKVEKPVEEKEEDEWDI